MATRTTYPGGTSAQTGDILTETIVSSLPGGWVGYAAVTSSQGSITTLTDATGLTLTWTALSNRKFRLYAEVGIFSSVANDGCAIYITNGSGTEVQGAKVLSVTDTLATKLAATAIIAPSSGSQTYKVRVERLSGSGNVTLYATSVEPAFLLIEDIGAAS